jgi:hypothetical protein
MSVSVKAAVLGCNVGCIEESRNGFLPLHIGSEVEAGKNQIR